MMEWDEDYRCGFVAVVGRPNVGKSTLINRLVGDKVSIVSPRPQTTRHRVLGVQTAPCVQLIYIDTPGLHVGERKAINQMMNKTATHALGEADAILWLVEADRWHPLDDNVVTKLAACKQPIIGVLNKVDLLRDKRSLLPAIEALRARRELHDILPVSALKGDQLDSLTEVLTALMPISPPLFPEDMKTDRDMNFRIGEIIREKLTLRLRQELPYGITVQVERREQEAERQIVHAVILVERGSQKGIVVGKGGQTLKAIGSAARRELNRLLQQSVHLELWVKVRDNWADSERELMRLGFDLDTQ
ncbi:MAG: GTPase Era [Pseudomonadota bacterium]